MSATLKATNLYSYQDQALNQRTLIAVASDGSGVPSIGNNVIYWDINGNPNNIFTPTRLATRCRMTDSRDFAFFCDGVSSDLFKWNIADGLSKWGIASPVSGPTIGSVVGSGSITLVKGRIYYIAYYNNTTQSYSDLSPASAITSALTAQNQDLTGLAVSSDSQVDHKILLATADGGDPTTLYEITTLTNATTTYTDSMPEATLLVQNVWQDTDSTGVLHGLFGNQPPPNGSFPISHNGRIFMAIGEVLYFSKSLAECTTASGIIAGRYEEAWVPTNAINVATAAEEIHGLLSDGQTLYIGTEEHIFRLTGDSPQNFSEPQIIFPQTGLLSQDVWQLVYLEGTPVGTMWMTPDLRVMSSDFNTYQDVGTQIQSTLNSINPNALGAAWAVMVSNGPYNFYMLAIPTGSNTVPDTFCVYDMRLRKWYIWQFADQFLSGIFYINLSGIPRWIFVDSTGTVRVVNSTDTLDRATDSSPQNITSAVQTSWLDMGDAQLRKTLNEIEVLTDDPNMTVSAYGASALSDLESPSITLVNGANLTTSLFGNGDEYKVYLAGTQAIDRFYKFKFQSVSSGFAVQSASTSTASGTSVAVTLPNPVAATDILVFDYEIAGASLTSIVDSFGNNYIGFSSGSGTRTELTFGQSGIVTVTLTASGTSGIYLSVLVIRGVSTTDTWGATIGSSGSPVTSPVVNTPQANCLVIQRGSMNGNSTPVNLNGLSPITSTGKTAICYSIVGPSGAPVDSSFSTTGSPNNSNAVVQVFPITAAPGSTILGAYSIEALPMHRY